MGEYIITPIVRLPQRSYPQSGTNPNINSVTLGSWPLEKPKIANPLAFNVNLKIISSPGFDPLKGRTSPLESGSRTIVVSLLHGDPGHYGIRPTKPQQHLEKSLKSAARRKHHKSIKASRLKWAHRSVPASRHSRYPPDGGRQLRLPSLQGAGLRGSPGV